MDLSPLWISLKTAFLSTFLTFFIGIFAAYEVAKVPVRPVKGLLDGFLTLPLILPPTVAGFFLLKIFGVNGPIGKLFLVFFDYRIVFSWPATVIAAATVAFPLMYRTTRGAFEQLDGSLIHAARTLGLSNSFIFWRVAMPNCWQSVMAGSVLTFARSLGEFGATIMLAGNLPGKTRTISTAVYSAMAAGNDQEAYRWVLVNLVISFVSMFLLNFWVDRRPKQRPVKEVP
jgi:molybdate ABC transporter, permease protein